MLSFGILGIIHKGEDIKRCSLRMPAPFPNTSWLAGEVLQHHCNQPPTLLLASHPPSCLKSRLLTAAEQLSVASAAMTGKPPCIHLTCRHILTCCGLWDVHTGTHPAKASVFLFPFSFYLSHCVPMIRRQWKPPPPTLSFIPFFLARRVWNCRAQHSSSPPLTGEKGKARERVRDEQSGRVSGTPHN